jgi:hypothetical protein
MKTRIKCRPFRLPLPLRQGERIACRAGVERRREVIGCESALELKLETLTLPSPLRR